VKSLTTYFELNTLDHGVGYDSRSGHLYPLDEEWGLDVVWANSEPRSSTQWTVNELTEVFRLVYLPLLIRLKATRIRPCRNDTKLPSN